MSHLPSQQEKQLKPATKLALEALGKELGEDQATLEALYKAARDENELLEFKNYELQFKIQELENKQRNLSNAITERGGPLEQSSASTMADGDAIRNGTPTTNPAAPSGEYAQNRPPAAQDANKAATKTGETTTATDDQDSKLNGQIGAMTADESNGPTGCLSRDEPSSLCLFVAPAESNVATTTTTTSITKVTANGETERELSLARFRRDADAASSCGREHDQQRDTASVLEDDANKPAGEENQKRLECLAGACEKYPAEADSFKVAEHENANELRERLSETNTIENNDLNHRGDRQRDSAELPSQRAASSRARIAMPVQRDAPTRQQQQQPQQHQAGQKRPQSRPSVGPATKWPLQPGRSAISRVANPMRARSKSSLDQSSVASQRRRLQQQPPPPRPVSLSMAPLNRAGSSALQSSQHHHGVPNGTTTRLHATAVATTRPQTTSPLATTKRSFSSACLLLSAGSIGNREQSLSNANAVKRPLRANNSTPKPGDKFVTQIPTLIDQLHAKSTTKSIRAKRLATAASEQHLASTPVLFDSTRETNSPTPNDDQVSNAAGKIEPRADEPTTTSLEVKLDREFSMSCVQLAGSANLLPRPSADNPTTEPIQRKQSTGEHEEYFDSYQLAKSVDQLAGTGNKTRCAQCKLLRLKLETLISERDQLNEQLNELEEMENDSRLMSQKLAKQLANMEKQLEECRVDLKRSCDNESKWRFQNKRLHFELRQRQDCIQNLQGQLSEMRSRARALMRLHRQTLDQKAKSQKHVQTIDQPDQMGEPVSSLEQPNSCASSQITAYDSVYSKSSISSSSDGCSTSGHGDSASGSSGNNSDVDACDEASGEIASAKASSSSQGLSDESKKNSAATSENQDVKPLLTGSKQVRTKHISMARIVRGVQVGVVGAAAASSNSDTNELDQGMASLERIPATNGDGKSYGAASQEVQGEGLEIARSACQLADGVCIRDSTAPAHLIARLSDPSSALSSCKLDQSFDAASRAVGAAAGGDNQGSKRKQPDGRSPIELALEGVDELERSGGGGNAALRSLCASSRRTSWPNDSDHLQDNARWPKGGGGHLDTAGGGVIDVELAVIESTASCNAGGESENSLDYKQLVGTRERREQQPVKTIDFDLIDGLKQEVSNLRLRLAQANTLNDNLILELKSANKRTSASVLGEQIADPETSLKGQQPDADLAPGEQSARDRVGASLRQQRDQRQSSNQRQASVIYVNGLSASVTHHHHHSCEQQQQNNQRIEQPVPQPSAYHNYAIENQRQQQQEQAAWRLAAERDLIEFLRFLLEKLHFHHGRTLELVSECQKLGMSTLLASYNQQISLYHHQRVVLAGNQAIRRAESLGQSQSQLSSPIAAAVDQRHQQQQQHHDLTLRDGAVPVAPLRAPPRRRGRAISGSGTEQLEAVARFQSLPVGDQLLTASEQKPLSCPSRGSPSAGATQSALQVAKQTLFSLVPIYYSCKESQQQQQQLNNDDDNNNKESALPARVHQSRASPICADRSLTFKQQQDKIRHAANRSNHSATSEIEPSQPMQCRVSSCELGLKPDAARGQLVDSNGIYATVSKNTAAVRGGVSVLKIPERPSEMDPLARPDYLNNRPAEGRSQSSQLHSIKNDGDNQLRQTKVFRTINQQHQQLAIARNSLSEEIERFRVHSNGQLLDLLTRQNWCESLITEKLKTYEKSQQFASASVGLVQGNTSALEHRQSTDSRRNSSDSLSYNLSYADGDSNLSSTTTSNIRILEDSAIFCDTPKLSHSVLNKQHLQQRPNLVTRSLSASSTEVNYVAPDIVNQRPSSNVGVTVKGYSDLAKRVGHVDQNLGRFKTQTTNSLC